MASRNTYKALLLIILVLLISNIIVLYLFVFSPERSKARHPNPGGREGLATILKDSVSFTDQQVAQYNELRNTERTNLRTLFRQMRRIKGEFYAQTTPPVADSVANSLADSIGITQKNIDLEMRRYFVKIREICTPEQLPAFDSVMSRVIITRMIGSRQSDKNKNNRAKDRDAGSK